MNQEAFNIQVCYVDGSIGQSSGIGFRACIIRAVDKALNNDQVEQVNIREIKGDWPIVASITMHNRI